MELGIQGHVAPVVQDQVGPGAQHWEPWNLCKVDTNLFRKDERNAHLFS